MKPSEMTDGQLRGRVAELLGWIPFWEPGEDDGVGRWEWHRGSENVRRAPDYPNDLNACHEMEDCIPEEKRTAYYLILCGSGPLIGTHWRITHATARQRCEAFVEVMSK